MVMKQYMGVLGSGTYSGVMSIMVDVYYGPCGCI